MTSSRRGWLRRVFSNLFSSGDEITATETRAEAHEALGVPMRGLKDRSRVRVAGIVTAVTIRPYGQTQSYCIDLYDGTGKVELVWLGRHQIRGVDPGRRLVAQGLVTMRRPGQARILNPRYFLLPAVKERAA